MPSHVPVDEIKNPALRSKVNELWAAYRDTPSDVLRTRDGHFYVSFDAWVHLVTEFRLRPRPAHLAVREFLYRVRRPHGTTRTARQVSQAAR